MKLLDLKIGKIEVGKVSQEVIDLLGITDLVADTPIVIWADRIKYIKKHINDFESEKQFEIYVEMIPELISEPDYVGLHPNEEGIEYVAVLRKEVLIGIRFKSNANELAIRSFYPLVEGKLDAYIQKGRFIEVPLKENKKASS